MAIFLWELYTVTVSHNNDYCRDNCMAYKGLICEDGLQCLIFHLIMRNSCSLIRAITYISRLSLIFTSNTEVSKIELIKFF